MICENTLCVPGNEAESIPSKRDPFTELFFVLTLVHQVSKLVFGFWKKPLVSRGIAPKRLFTNIITILSAETSISQL